MVNPAQLEDKVRLLIVNPDFTGALLKKCDQLINAGAIDLDKHDNDYMVPKAVLHVALLYLADQYEPLGGEGKEIIKNLKKF